MQKEENQSLEKEPGKVISKSINEHLKYLKKSIKNVELQIEKLVKENAKNLDDVLQSEKGIGAQTSAIFIGSLPELRRIHNRQIAKLLGLAPMARDSDLKSGKRSIRSGRHRVRNAIYMASIGASKGERFL